jgi:hypothetical protein
LGRNLLRIEKAKNEIKDIDSQIKRAMSVEVKQKLKNRRKSALVEMRKAEETMRKNLKRAHTSTSSDTADTT